MTRKKVRYLVLDQSPIDMHDSRAYGLIKICSHKEEVRCLRLSVSRFALFFFVAVFATTAMSGESATPSGKVSIQSRSIAAGVGVTWGDGRLSFKGKDYAFTVNGLSLVDWGISRASANGEVYNLTDVAMFAGNY